MKKSDTIFDTDIHELFHMTQRNVHHRSEYESTAFNKRQTILLATEDIGIRPWTRPTTTSSRRGWCSA